jgi:BASS family bile acid:Na+ symporter
VDDIALNFNQSSLIVMNVTLAFIMFGIALDLSFEKFKGVLKTPRKVIAGLIGQLILLPLLTYVLVVLLEPAPSLALGMFLVAACPGGNISNFISSLAKANVALSISLTSITSLLAVITTPLNFGFYGNLYEPTHLIMREISLDWLEVVRTICMIILVPIVLGLTIKTKFPKVALKMARPLEVVSMVLFMLIVLGALMSNLDQFMACIGGIFLYVLAHNATALITGYTMGSLVSKDFNDRKALAIETGIQNSGLGLLIIFAFFEGLGGMAIIAAWWGIWHMVSGFTLAYIWRKH